jgi:hypothetical protein
MIIDIAAESARFEIGRVVRRMCDVIAKNFVSFIVLSLIFSSPGFIFVFRGLLAVYLHIHIQPWLNPRSVYATFVNLIGSSAISFVFQKMLEASVAHGMMTSLNGGKASFAACLAIGLKNALPLTAIALIAFVAILLGLVVLIVPGIVLVLMFSVVAPVRAMEHTGIADTLNRSTELIHGHKNQIFALFVVYYVFALAIGFSLRPLSGLAFFGAGGARNSILVFMALSGFMRVFLGLLLSAGVASVYYELRLAKEGYEPEQLAAVFA